MAGRKPYEPTETARSEVARFARERLTRREIAERIGVSVPTLIKAYSAELEAARADGDAPLLHFDQAHAPSPTRRISGRSGGRPTFSPTHEQRRDVMLFLAEGWPKADIASALDISVPTLEKYFADELRTGAIKARAENLRRLRSAAASGNVSAMRALQERFDVVESAGKPVSPDQPVPKPKEDTPGKKALATRAAHEAITSGPWADLLRTRAN